MSCHLTMDYISSSLRNYSILSLNKRANDHTLITTGENPQYEHKSLIQNRKGGFKNAGHPFISSSYFLINNNPEKTRFKRNGWIEQEMELETFFGEKIYPSEEDIKHVTKKFRVDYPEGKKFFSGGTWKNFFKRSKPTGFFYHDDIDGNRVGGDKVRFNGVEELGEVISSTLDYYACPARNYFEFLTGQSILFFADYPESKGGNSLTNSNRFSKEQSIERIEKFETEEGW